MYLYDISFLTDIFRFNCLIWAHDEEEATKLISRQFKNIERIISIKHRSLARPEILAYCGDRRVD